MDTVIWQDAKSAAECNIQWSMLERKKVLITGATGFIGASIINTLMYRNINLNSNIKIAASVRSKEKALSMFSEYSNTGLLEYVEGDVCDPVKYDGDIDFIIHCASNAAPNEYFSDPVGTMATNFFGTFNLLNFAKEKNVKKFLYVSTIEIYGTTEGNSEIEENDYGYIDAVSPRSCYTISKKACETACIAYGQQYEIPVSIGRLSYIFGPGMKKNDSKVVSILARAAAAGEEMVLKSKGEQLRSYTYISDAVSGLLTVMIEGANNEAYNIASSLCITTIADIGHTLENLYQDKGVKLRFDLPTNQEKKAFSPIKNAVLSNKKLKSIGWTEKVDLKKGLSNMVKSMISCKEDK